MLGLARRTASRCVPDSNAHAVSSAASAASASAASPASAAPASADASSLRRVRRRTWLVGLGFRLGLGLGEG